MKAFEISSDVEALIGVGGGKAIIDDFATMISKKAVNSFERISKLFTETGFFNYVKTLKMKKEDFKKAIDIAPSIKPSRYTYVHVEENRILAKKFIDEDETLNSILL